MKTLTIEGRTVLAVNYKRNTLTRLFRQVFLCKRGSRVHVEAEYWNDIVRRPLEEIEANGDFASNFAIGPKRFATMLTDALNGKVVEEVVSSTFDRLRPGESRRRGPHEAKPWLYFKKNGRYLHFQAPCGANGYLTVGEATRLRDALLEL